MARETKAQREARVELINIERDEEMRATWQARVMAALERASKRAMRITVVDEKFKVMLVNQFNDEVTLTFTFDAALVTTLDESSLDLLEYELAAADARDTELARKKAVREVAISKLTDEERKELNL